MNPLLRLFQAPNFVYFFILGLLVLPHNAWAGDVINTDVFDSLLLQFQQTALLWKGEMLRAGLWLFWSLCLVDMVWTFGMLAIGGADTQKFFIEAIRFLTTTGFYLWILTNGAELAIAIINTLRQIASKASGLGGDYNSIISPSGVVDIGFHIVSQVIDHTSIWSPVMSTAGIIVALVILIFLSYVGIEMLLALITVWIVVYGGIVVLGFGGSKWTQETAINYYKLVLSTALQIFSMILIMGIGQSFIDIFYQSMNQSFNLKSLTVMLVASLILAAIMQKIPPIIGGLAGFHGGGAGGSAGSLIAAAGMAASSATMMGQGLAKAGASMTGGAQALHEAFKSAQAATSGGALASPGASKNTRGNIASAFSYSGNLAKNFGSHLAQGAAQTVKDRVSSVFNSEAITQSFGGETAKNITDRAASTPIFDGNQMSSGATVSDAPQSPHVEVNDFINKGRV